jgi:hypothetical protein
MMPQLEQNHVDDSVSSTLESYKLSEISRYGSGIASRSSKVNVWRKTLTGSAHNSTPGKRLPPTSMSRCARHNDGNTIGDCLCTVSPALVRGCMR